MLAVTEQAMGSEVIVALVGAGGLVMTAFVSGTIAMLKTSRSVGAKNGHGSLQESLALIHDRHEFDEERRLEGVKRQEQMKEAIETIQTAMIAVKEQIEANKAALLALKGTTEENSDLFLQHTAVDQESFDRLTASVEEVKQLLGTPREGDLHDPLIPYIHESMHRLMNSAAITGAEPAVRMQALGEAVKMLDEYRKALDAALDTG